MGGFGQSVWLQMAEEAISGLRSQGRRSVLALLGVMIGSASIVALNELCPYRQNRGSGPF